MNEVRQINEADFQHEVLESTTPVLVDFTATWCGPCKMVDPIVRQLAEEWSGTVRILKMDADANPSVLATYGVMSIPTLLLFKNGEVAERTVGFQSKVQIIGKFGRHLKT